MFREQITKALSDRYIIFYRADMEVGRDFFIWLYAPAKIEIPGRHLCRAGLSHFTPFPNSRTGVAAARRDARSLASKFGRLVSNLPLRWSLSARYLGNIGERWGRGGGNTPRPDFLSPCWQGFIKVSMCVARLSRGDFTTTGEKTTTRFVVDLIFPVCSNHFCNWVTMLLISKKSCRPLLLIFRGRGDLELLVQLL